MAEVEEVVPQVAPINGWVPDESKPCYVLPGAIAPLGFFDPLGFSNGKELVGVNRLREAEIMHGRVAMMATVGYLIGESTPTEETMAELEEVVPQVAPINGWVPDESKPCYGLPGAIAPLGFFDPLGFSNGKELGGVKRLREA